VPTVKGKRGRIKPTSERREEQALISKEISHVVTFPVCVRNNEIETSNQHLNILSSIS
jgi:hypothetical protein